MRCDFGFVSICLSEEACSPAGNVTYRSIESLDRDAKRLRILRTARRNLENTLRIMWFLHAHDISLYRISATLIPLATHPVTENWPWWEEPSLLETGEKIGRVAREKGYRLSSHLPEVCGFTSEQSWEWTKEYLAYHKRLFSLLGLQESARIVIHVGGAYGDKESALDTASANLKQLSDWERNRIVLENDDRTYTVTDVTHLAESADVAVVFDWHHHVVNPGDAAKPERLLPYLRRAADRWRDRPMKVHVSSPKNPNQVRAHADYVDVAFVEPFFRLLQRLDLERVDVMVEAKEKDRALFRLRDEWDARTT